MKYVYYVVLAVAILLSHALTSLALPSGSVDLSFDPGGSAVDNQLYTIAFQTNGQMLLAGNMIHQGVVRLNADGTADNLFTNSFQWFAGWSVYALGVQPDGKILVGGDFPFGNESDNPANDRYGIERLNPDGSRDNTFQIGDGFYNRIVSEAGQVYAIAIQPDGKILVGGSFNWFNQTDRHCIARLNADGTLDVTFQNGMAGVAGHSIYRPFPGPLVSSLALQPDGKVIIAGIFTSVDGVSRTNIARLNSDGSLDTTFQNGMSGTDYAISAVAVQTNGQVVIGGVFSLVNGVARNQIARLNPDGTLDTMFLDGMLGPTGSPDLGLGWLVLQPDDKILICGSFSGVNGATRRGIARLNTDGSVDAMFQNGMAGVQEYGTDPTNPPGNVQIVARQPDGKVVIGGNFQSVNGVMRFDVARLNIDGGLDTSFPAGHPGILAAIFGNGKNEAEVLSLAVQPNNKVIVGGFFDSVDGVPRYGIARLNADGTHDTTFQNGMFGANDAGVSSVALQPDGKILIAGQFTYFNEVARTKIARLNPDGSLDSFPSSVSHYYDNFSSFISQPDGKMLIGGTFTAINGAACTNLARFNSNGTLDAGFKVSLDGGVTRILLKPDGKLLIIGDFISVNGTDIANYGLYGIAQLNSNGTFDNTFTNGFGQGPNSPNEQFAVQSDGKLLMNDGGASLRRLNTDGSADTNFNRFVSSYRLLSDSVFSTYAILPQADGKIIIAGKFHAAKLVGSDFVTFSRNVARLNSDGTLDPTFQADVDLQVRSVAMQSDGKILVGGSFFSVNGTLRPFVARLHPTATGPLSVAITTEYTNLASGLALDLSALITGNDNSNFWDFGDETTASNQFITSHTWNAAGIYTMLFRAYNDDNPGGVSATVTIRVLDNPVQYVSLSNANPASPYATWATAATNIQDALDVPILGETIMVVSNGVYQTGQRVTSDVYQSWTNRVAVTRPLLVQSVNGPNVTSINGAGLMRGVFLTNSATLAGFTVTTGTGGASGGTLVNCTLTGNIGYGAEACLLIDCTLANNFGAGASNNCRLNNCLITGNTGSGASRSALFNCTVTGNPGGGLADSSFAYNSIIYYNTGTNHSFDSGIDHCCTTLGQSFYGPGSGNITNEPAFVNPALGNLRLQSNSPCINAAAAVYRQSDSDLDGNPRIVGGALDIGAYEFQTPSSVISYAWLQQNGLPSDGSADHVDSDGDHFDNFQEWRTGTSPLDAASFLKIMSITKSAGNLAIITWKSVPNIEYIVERSPSPKGPFTLIAHDISQYDDSGTVSWSDYLIDPAVDGDGPFFYRVGVQ